MCKFQISKEITLADYLYAQTANIDYIEHLDPDNMEDEVLNPLNMNFEELSFENLVSASQLKSP